MLLYTTCKWQMEDNDDVRWAPICINLDKVATITMNIETGNAVFEMIPNEIYCSTDLDYYLLLDAIKSDPIAEVLDAKDILREAAERGHTIKHDEDRAMAKSHVIKEKLN